MTAEEAIGFVLLCTLLFMSRDERLDASENGENPDRRIQQGEHRRVGRVAERRVDQSINGSIAVYQNTGQIDMQALN